MTTQTEVLKHEIHLVLTDPDTNLSHGARRALDYVFGQLEAFAQPEHEKERCVGCEACIDTACGRDECPKGWPKAAQPEQEPVGQLLEDAFGRGQVMWFNKPKDESMLYTTPPQRTWVGLTDDEVLDALKCLDSQTARLPQGFKLFAQSIESILKEKNT